MGANQQMKSHEILAEVHDRSSIRQEDWGGLCQAVHNDDQLAAVGLEGLDLEELASAREHAVFMRDYGQSMAPDHGY